MEKLKDLKDLLTHEIQDLYSAEEQIIEAMPAMIEKSKDAELKKSLKEHLRITEEHKSRLDDVKRMLKEFKESNEEQGQLNGEDIDGEEKKGFLSSLFGGLGGSQVCKGMMGLIDEGKKIMNQEMDPDVLDAAIIASAQKIEHYEICGYGTARAFAKQLDLNEVATLLERTLNEEYDADDRLTVLAIGRLNEEAESKNPRRARTRITARPAKAAKKATPKKSANSGRSSGPKAATKTAKKAAPSKKSAVSKKSAASKKSAPSKKSAAAKKGATSKSPAARGSKSGGRTASKSASRRR